MKIPFPENPLAERKKVRIAVRLKNKGAQAVRKGHPWVFEDSVEKLSRDGAAGSVAVLYDGKSNSVLGAGLYDPRSQVRVKVLSYGSKNPPVGKPLFLAGIRKALEPRLPALPPETEAWRVVHGESDGFPGLVCDKYGDTLVLKLYSAAWIAWADEAAEALTELLPEIRRVVIRLSREVAATPEGASWCPDGSVFTCDGAPFDGSLTFLENGIRFAADVIRGQKTGFFLDQRDNRDRVRRLASGKRVLNVFSYSGGFSLYAAAGGATEVVSVDINRHAAGAVAENFALNPFLTHCPHGEIAADAFVAMGDLAAKRRRFDLVIVDPPSFAKAEAEVRTALNTYSRLAKAAVKLLAPHGLLVFASCSSRVTADALFSVVKEAASSAGRPLNELERTAHAVDHPAKFRESSYLKCMYAEAKN